MSRLQCLLGSSPPVFLKVSSPQKAGRKPQIRIPINPAINKNSNITLLLPLKAKMYYLLLNIRGNNATDFPACAGRFSSIASPVWLRPRAFLIFSDVSGKKGESKSAISFIV